MVIKQIDIRLANQLSEMEALVAVLDFFAEHAEVPPRAAFNMNLAVDEFVSNCIKYGYRDGRAGEIEVRLRRENDELELVVSDDGDVFDPFTAPPPDLESPVEERSIGGLGIHLVRRFADGVSYERAGERNVVTIRLKLSSP